MYYIMSLSSINAPMIEVSIIMVAKAATMANLIAVKAAITDASLIIQIAFLIAFPFVVLFLIMMVLYHTACCLSTPIVPDCTSNRNNLVRYWSSVQMFHLLAG